MNENFQISLHNKQLLKATDIARILNISKSLAYELMKSGEIQTLRIGSARRVRTEDLNSFIEQNLKPAQDHI